MTVPKLPGLVTEGDNLKDSREMAKDAIRVYLESILKKSNLISKNPLRVERLKVAF